MVVPLLSFDEVVIEYVYRYPASETLIEFPAGMVDSDESTHECAARELLEETGYAARMWAFAGRYFNAPAYSSEFIDIWIAYELSFQGLEADPNEPMQIATMKIVDLMQEVKALRVRDMRTAFAALTAERLLAERDAIPWQTA
jgi:ADP-ribose pyrophosphatase